MLRQSVFRAGEPNGQWSGENGGLSVRSVNYLVDLHMEPGHSSVTSTQRDSSVDQWPEKCLRVGSWSGLDSWPSATGRGNSIRAFQHSTHGQPHVFANTFASLLVFSLENPDNIRLGFYGFSCLFKSYTIFIRHILMCLGIPAARTLLQGSGTASIMRLNHFSRLVSSG